MAWPQQSRPFWSRPLKVGVEGAEGPYFPHIRAVSRGAVVRSDSVRGDLGGLRWDNRRAKPGHSCNGVASTEI